jgi:o-succinylbenzoate synthase
MIKAEWRHYQLNFRETAITSRSRMNVKDTYFIKLFDTDAPDTVGYGECALFRGLSAEDTPDYARQLAEACAHPDTLPEISSIRFGFETALADLHTGGRQVMVSTPFTHGGAVIPINGLVWMGDKATMRRRIAQKLDQGFHCIKLKIGGIDFNDELELLRVIRSEFDESTVELRVDANGAFTPDNVDERLARLAEFHLHSIEQPIKQHQWAAMAKVCATSPIPIALDEELIGFTADSDRARLLNTIRPQYIILKPSLCGGFAEADKWIAAAEQRNISWWATSALESNIGLNAIAQWVSQKSITMPQGLGTGALYTNNIPSPLRQEHDYLHFDPTEKFHNLATLFNS